MKFIKRRMTKFINMCLRDISAFLQDTTTNCYVAHLTPLPPPPLPNVYLYRQIYSACCNVVQLPSASPDPFWPSATKLARFPSLISLPQTLRFTSLFSLLPPPHPIPPFARLTSFTALRANASPESRFATMVTDRQL